MKIGSTRTRNANSSSTSVNIELPQKQLLIFRNDMTEKVTKPSLFGIVNSNRDFTIKECWGKNQFNSSFPAALACYLSSKALPAVCLSVDERLNPAKKLVPVNDIFGIDPLSKDTFFSFETQYLPLADLSLGALPRVDLVIMDTSKKEKRCLAAFEVKLTALPDNTTCENSEDKYGCELVVRPDTVVYMALGLARQIRLQKKSDEVANLLKPMHNTISDWTNGDLVCVKIPMIAETLKSALIGLVASQTSLLLQPVWKTKGKSTELAEDCLDIFFWTDFALLKLLLDSCRKDASNSTITRQERALVWLFAMLYEYTEKGKVNSRRTIDSITFNKKNDKAFASSGKITFGYMKGAELHHPRISKAAISEIILGGGQNFLSPERRLDAAILATRNLFK